MEDSTNGSSLSTALGGRARERGSIARRLLTACLAFTLVSATPLGTPSSVTGPQVAAAGTVGVSVPFRSSPSNGVWYRIPAVITNAQGHVLAFAERRDNDKIDMGDFDVVMRTSTDGGLTWGPIQVVAEDGRNRISNPVPILDPLSGHVLLITSIRTENDVYKGLYMQRSTDGGLTFTELSKSRIRPTGSWKGGLSGPGHGVVLRNGTHAGRILFAMGYRRGSGYGAYGIYSDDGGHTWRTGFDHEDPTGSVGFIEGTITELPDGRLHISFRDKLAKTPGHTRQYAFSDDGGLTLSQPFRAAGSLKMHSVQGSALSVTGTYAGLTLFSAPTFTATTDRSLRRDMGIFTSLDGGSTWRTPYPVELESKPGAYSDLVQLEDDVVGILYETGTVKWRERIVFRRVCLHDVVSTQKVASSVAGKMGLRTAKVGQRVTVVSRVKVPGSVAPPGKVTVRYKGKKRSGRVSAALTYTSKGTRYLRMPKLPRGTYRVWVEYSGNVRIAKKTVYLGRLRIR